MLALLFELGGLAAVGYLGLVGSTLGTIPATVRALQLFAALAGAMLFFDGLAAVIEPVLASLGGRDFVAMPWAMFLSFGILYGVFLAAAIIITPPELTEPPDDPDDLPRHVRIGGGILGGVVGVLLVGTTFIVLSFLPVPGWLHIRTYSMYYDLGAVCVRAVAPFLGTLAVFGEPVAAQGDTQARMASEVWADVDGDGSRGETDLYVDRDGSGGFSEQSAYVDLDGNWQRKVGLLEKYAVWTWDNTALHITHVGPPAPPPGPGEGDAQPASPPPPKAGTEEDIPGKKPAATDSGKKPKSDEEPSDDF